jgi:hypothetical protein
MAVKTNWTVEHQCGHTQERDLSDKRPSERAGRARWLASKDCSQCWQAQRDKDRSAERLAQRRQDEAARIEAWERSAAMPSLNGSDKVLAWGGRVRHHLMDAAHEYAQSIGVSDEDFAEQVEAPARNVTSAGWWIDQRGAPAEDVAELVLDAAANPLVHAGTENPY